MRLDPDLKAKLKRLAERENRSLTNYIETALRRLTDGEPDDRKRAHARA
jgi:predicted transcriptional regulator